MKVMKLPTGEQVVSQTEYRVYIDPETRQVEWDTADTTGRAGMFIGQKLTLKKGMFGGTAKNFVVVAFHPGHEYDVVVYEKAKP